MLLYTPRIFAIYQLKIQILIFKRKFTNYLNVFMSQFVFVLILKLLQILTLFVIKVIITFYAKA